MITSLFSTLPMWICLLWIIILLIKPTKSNLPKKFLGFFFILSFINYFCHSIYFNSKYTLYSCMESIWIFTSLSAYPLYYYYIRLLTKDTKIKLSWIWILIPSIILSLFSWILYFSMNDYEINIFINKILYNKSYNRNYTQILQLEILKSYLFKILFIIQIILTLFFGLKHIIIYNKELKDFYSNTRNKDLNPIKWLLVVFTFASIISILSAIIGKSSFMANPYLIIIPSITHSLFLFGVGYIGNKQNFIITDFREDIISAENIEKDKAIEKDDNSNIYNTKQEFLILLEEKHIFKNADLRISDISSMLRTNRTYMSRLVNEEFHKNFADFINDYRINYSKDILEKKEYDHITMSEISEMSGFSSESSFYRVFKEKEGISPGNYRKKKQK